MIVDFTMAFHQPTVNYARAFFMTDDSLLRAAILYAIISHF